VGVPACTAHISLRCFRRRLSYPRPLRWAVATPHRMLAEHPLHAAQAESELGSEVAPSRFCLGAYLAKRSELISRTRSKTTPANIAGRRSGCVGNSPKHRTYLRNRSLAGRQRHRSPRPASNRRNPARNTLPALWKQRLDRHIAHSTDSSTSARADERRAGHTALSRQRLYQGAERRRSGPSSPGR